MTAFASQTGDIAGQSWDWEIRGVNGRGLDLRMRLPDGCDGLEAGFRTAITARLSRGNVTLTLRMARSDTGGRLAIDDAQLDRVLSAMDIVKVRARAKRIELAETTALDVLTFRGVVQADQGALRLDDINIKSLQSELDVLLQDFITMRAQEGQALHDLIFSHLADIEVLVIAATQAAEARRPESETGLRAALRRVIDEVREVDETRLLQELALLAVKADVTEELGRLSAHITAARAIIDDPKPAGRRLDFLAQEFNREANTLCAKAGSTELTRIGLDLKAAIDQMREQIQNVE